MRSKAVCIVQVDGDLLRLWSDEALLTERRRTFGKDLQRQVKRSTSARPTGHTRQAASPGLTGNPTSLKPLISLTRPSTMAPCRPRAVAAVDIRSPHKAFGPSVRGPWMNMTLPFGALSICRYEHDMRLSFR